MFYGIIAGIVLVIVGAIVVKATRPEWFATAVGWLTAAGAALAVVIDKLGGG